MLHRPFGATGVTVPALGFGAMQIGAPDVSEADAERALNAALDLGVTLIDTARSYGESEARIGRYLSHRRSELVLSTKVGYGVEGVPDWTYECVRRGVDAARARMRTDFIDIVHLHSCDRAGGVCEVREQGRRRAAPDLSAAAAAHERLHSRGGRISESASGEARRAAGAAPVRGAAERVEVRIMSRDLRAVRARAVRRSRLRSSAAI